MDDRDWREADTDAAKQPRLPSALTGWTRGVIRTATWTFSARSPLFSLLCSLPLASLCQTSNVPWRSSKCASPSSPTFAPTSSLEASESTDSTIKPGDFVSGPMWPRGRWNCWKPKHSLCPWQSRELPGRASSRAAGGSDRLVHRQFGESWIVKLYDRSTTIDVNGDICAVHGMPTDDGPFCWKTPIAAVWPPSPVRSSSNGCPP